MSETQQIVNDIKDFCIKNKQNGLIELTKKFDNVALSSFVYKVSNDIVIEKALEDSIKIARDNIYKFHKSEYDKLLCFEADKIETSQGITCWKKFTPIQNVGVYVPNNLFSSVLMNIIPAQIAGCKNIVVCTPPNPSNQILWTLNLLGIKQIYTIGGAQAIFAMAYGIGEIPKVDKIFGPGNEFVDAAKYIVQKDVAIDMPAGPSEVLVIADVNANKNAVMFDLLAQLEHGKQSKAWLFCLSDELATFIGNNIYNIAKKSSRFKVLECSIKNLVIKTFDGVLDAIEECNNIAPEHLILNIANAEQYLNGITNAGCVFVGANTPESLGDYISGTNHVLPTNGFAKAFSGLCVMSFGKFISFQTATKNGLDAISQNIATMANAEGLEFHALSINRS